MNVLSIAGLANLEKLVLKGGHAALGCDEGGALRCLMTQLTTLDVVLNPYFWYSWGAPIQSETL